MTILIDFDILQQQLSMIAFSYALILVFRLRYTVEEHSGKILAPGSEYPDTEIALYNRLYRLTHFMTTAVPT